MYADSVLVCVIFALNIFSIDGKADHRSPKRRFSGRQFFLGTSDTLVCKFIN